LLMESPRPSKNVAIVTGTVTRTQVMVVATDAASSEGRRDATWGLATLASCVLWALAILHL
jgi:hypothetical protein